MGVGSGAGVAAAAQVAPIAASSLSLAVSAEGAEAEVLAAAFSVPASGVSFAFFAPFSGSKATGIMSVRFRPRNFPRQPPVRSQGKPFIFNTISLMYLSLSQSLRMLRVM